MSDKSHFTRQQTTYFQNGNNSLMNNSTTETEEEEPEECPVCDGYGELPGNPNTNDFPTCHACNGTGLIQK